VACATELAVELIVMGKHRLGLVEHLLASSVTEKVVRHAPCPVLSEAGHPEDFRSGEENRKGWKRCNRVIQIQTFRQTTTSNCQARFDD
jgi:hypothetical protein